jgi:O-methyltransferase
MRTYNADIISTDANTDFMLDPKFIEAYNACKIADGNRLLGNDYDIRWRIHTFLWAAKYASKIEGDFVDIGGGFGLFSSAIYKFLDFQNLDKTYFLLDSFQGLEDKNLEPEEVHRLSVYRRHGNWYEEIKEKFKDYHNMKIIPGFIPDTLSQITTEKIAYASIDLNCVQPEKDALAFIWEKLVNGGIIVFDDYAFPGHEKQKKSHDAFAKEKNCLIFTVPTGHGVLIKS